MEVREVDQAAIKGWVKQLLLEKYRSLDKWDRLFLEATPICLSCFMMKLKGVLTYYVAFHFRNENDHMVFTQKFERLDEYTRFILKAPPVFKAMMLGDNDL